MENPQEQETQHAILVIWGKFAQETGLISGIESVKLGQKIRDHTPQSKVLELLVGIMSGVKYLQDLSLSAHPLVKTKTWRSRKPGDSAVGRTTAE